MYQLSEFDHISRGRQRLLTHSFEFHYRTIMFSILCGLDAVHAMYIGKSYYILVQSPAEYYLNANEIKTCILYIKVCFVIL